jgi:hypothetical protein
MLRVAGHHLIRFGMAGNRGFGALRHRLSLTTTAPGGMQGHRVAAAGGISLVVDSYLG